MGAGAVVAGGTVTGGRVVNGTVVGKVVTAGAVVAGTVVPGTVVEATEEVGGTAVVPGTVVKVVSAAGFFVHPANRQIVVSTRIMEINCLNMEYSSFCLILTENTEKCKYKDKVKRIQFLLPRIMLPWMKEILAFSRKKAYNKLIHFTYFYEVLLCI